MHRTADILPSFLSPTPKVKLNVVRERCRKGTQSLVWTVCVKVSGCQRNHLVRCLGGLWWCVWESSGGRLVCNYISSNSVYSVLSCIACHCTSITCTEIALHWRMGKEGGACIERDRMHSAHPARQKCTLVRQNAPSQAKMHPAKHCSNFIVLQYTAMHCTLCSAHRPSQAKLDFFLLLHRQEAPALHLKFAPYTVRCNVRKLTALLSIDPPKLV